MKILTLVFIFLVAGALVDGRNVYNILRSNFVMAQEESETEPETEPEPEPSPFPGPEEESGSEEEPEQL